MIDLYYPPYSIRSAVPATHDQNQSALIDRKLRLITALCEGVCPLFFSQLNQRKQYVIFKERRHGLRHEGMAS